MKPNQERNLAAVSKIDDDIIEKQTKKRIHLLSCNKRSRKSLKKWYIMGASLAACAAIVLGVIFLIVPMLTGSGKQIPVYTGMTVSNQAPTQLWVGTAPEYADDGNNGNHYGRYKGDYKQDQEIPEEPFPDNPLSGSLTVPSSDSGYYASPGEDVYITVHLSNPDKFEILSFTLNGEKYSSYMFEDGSDLENLVLKVNVGQTEGMISYTIDAIKYVEGEAIKDVRMEGDQTVEIGVYTEKQPTATVSAVTVGFNSLSFTVSGTDEMHLIANSNGKVEAVLYDGDTIVAKKEVSLTEGATVTFDELRPNTLYQYAVVASYDALDGKGFSSYILKEAAFYTEAPLLFDEVTLSATGVAFALDWHEQASGSVERIVLSDGKTERELATNATAADGLLPDTAYTLTVTYKNGDRTEQITLELTTAPLTYTVNHYLAAPDGSFGEAIFSETAVISPGETYTATPADYEGFVTPEAQSGTATTEGELIINYYYARAVYDITLVYNDGTRPIQSLTFGATLPTKDRDGFVFGGWFTDEGCTKPITTVPAASVTVYAQWLEETAVSALSYSEANNEVTITGLKADLTSLVLPAYIGGKPVTAIAARAFAGLAQLTAVHLPNTLRELGQAAFKDCTGLTELVIPDSVTYIGDHLLSGCSSLVSLTIPFVGDCVKTANDTYQYPFGYIFGSTKYTGGVLTETYYYGAELNETTQGISYLPTTLKHVTVTGGNILYGAFRNCFYLESITLPENLTALGAYAFHRCYSLQSITIPDTVKSIGSVAFYRCYRLAQVTNLSGLAINSLPDNVFLEIRTSLDTPFTNTFVTTEDGLMTITKDGVVYLVGYNGSATALDLTGKGINKIHSGAFLGCESLISVVIPATVDYIGEQAFAHCTALESLTIPFVGAELKTDNDINQYPFGWIFGYGKYSNSVAVNQTYIASSLSQTATYSCHIPDTLKSVTVLGGSILRGAFQNCTMLTEVNMPEGLTRIGMYAFANCTALTQIVLPDTVEYIDASAFVGCIDLASVETSGVLKAIYSWAFKDCTKLSAIELPSTVTNVVGDAFEGCTALQGYEYGNAVYLGNENDKYIVLLRAASLDITSCDIPSTTRWIHKGAFQNCTALTAVAIPASVKIISSYSFDGCTLLSELTFAEGCQLTSIPVRAFANTAITSLKIPASVTMIGEAAFLGCTRLVTVEIPATVQTINYRPFEGCTKLESLIIPFVGKRTATGNDYTQYPLGHLFGMTEYEGTTATQQTYLQFTDGTSKSITSVYYIPDSLTSVTVLGGRLQMGAFRNCRYITSVTLPESAPNIQPNAFSGSGMTSVTIPAGIKSIYSNAFANCASLTTLTFAEGSQLTEIRDTSFANVPLVTVTVPVIAISALPKDALKTVTVIGSTAVPANAFAGATKLTAVTLSEGITGIGESAFKDCTGLTEITLPASLTTVGSNAFNGSGLTSVTFAEGSTAVPANAFYGVSKLATVSLPDSIKYIGEYAFRNCKSLETIELPAELGIIGNGAFNGSGLTSVTLPAEVGELEQYAFANCTALQTVSLPISLRHVGTAAFTNCTALVRVDYTGTLASWMEIRFENGTANPISKLGALYINDVNVITATMTVPAEVTSIGSYVFYGCTAITELNIHAGVIEVGEGAFAACAGIVKATVPALALNKMNKTGLAVLEINAGTELDVSALKECTKLATVKLPETLTAVGASAFRGCTALESITLPATVKSLAADAFAGCTALARVDYAGTLSDWCRITFANAAANPVSLTGALYIDDVNAITPAFAVPTEVTSIGAYAFYGCTAITELYIHAGVTSIGTSAFGGCAPTKAVIPVVVISQISNTNLEHLEINGGAIIPTSAFRDCATLKTVVIGNTVTEIGNNAFDYCYNITSVTFESNSQLTHIGELAFYECFKLLAIDLPASVTTVGRSTFNDCESLATVTFGENSKLTNISNAMFCGCDSLSTIRIPSGVTVIEGSAFVSCDNLTSVVIPSSVTGIGFNAFQQCSKLTSVTFENAEGWWYASNSVATSGTSIEAADLSNAATAASYLVYTYRSYYWKCD